jgi:guanosine-3',5'-bis(diphosphate) 3'-pyrophosphohydrolase
MQYEESVTLGERLLGQALRQHDLALGQIEPALWDKFLRETGAKTRQNVLADIGLGKRLAAIVARRLAEGYESGRQVDAKPPSAILIRGTEGIAVQLAKCCRPIPGDAIVGLIKKGQGLVVHTADCSSVARGRSERDKPIEVEWERDSGRLFDVAIRVVAENKRGVLAKVAAQIAEDGSNIQNVSMDDERGPYTALYFCVQVADRTHLARLMRDLRHVPEVMRITRVRGDAAFRERVPRGEE